MKRKTAYAATISALVLLGCQVSLGDDDSSDDDKHYALWQPQPGVDPVQNAAYVEECGSCHMAYPAGLLPARSWEKIMLGLDDHFGDNAQLEPQLNRELTDFLLVHSADAAPYRRSRKVMHSLTTTEAPMRITELPYIRHEHDEIPDRLVTGNKQVGSLSNCDACHQQAARGSFSERQIRIPGVGRWDG